MDRLERCFGRELTRLAERRDVGMKQTKEMKLRPLPKKGILLLGSP